MLGHDDAVLAGVARMLAPGAVATVLFSVVERDGMPEPAHDLAAAYARHGLGLVEVRAASADEVAATTWAKRLRAGRARPVTVLRARANVNGGW